MKTTTLLLGILATTMVLLTASALGQAEITVTCDPAGGVCTESLDPLITRIPVGGNVQFFLSASCVNAPCGPCTITIPAGPGFPGFVQAGITEPGIIGPTPAFAAPGVFPYTVACSEIEGLIVVYEYEPSMNVWGLIALSVLIVAAGTFFFLRRRSALA